MNWWKQQTIWIVGTLCVLAGVLGSVWGIELESSDQTGGPTPQELAEVIVDETAHLELVPSSASTAINTTLGSVSTNPRAIGKFFYGITSPGTDLPDEYQPDPQNPTLTYDGGIGIASGICLSTGLLTDDDDHISALSGYGIGVEGPNNGYPLAGGGEGPGYVNIGEVSADLQRPADDDYVDRVAAGTDATTLTFDIELYSPGIL